MKATKVTHSAVNQISQVKERISKEKGWDAAAQKLIYSGKTFPPSHIKEAL